MEAIANWLKRVGPLTAESNIQATEFRMIMFGEHALDLDNWLLTFDPQGPLHSTPHSFGPESWSLLRLPDVAQQEIKLHERHKLGADLAAAISLALGRRVVIPNDFPLSIQGYNQTMFQSASHVVDRCILGPLPRDARERLSDVFTAIHGLPHDDLVVIGAATSAHHSALLLFDKEPRVAYTLLVAGMETLSRRYGAPPTDWESWDDSGSWTLLLTALELQPKQAVAIRDHLMKDRHLRLSATFRQYAATRPTEEFWQRSIDAWVPRIDGNTGQCLSPAKSSSHQVSDFVPHDRSQLRKALAKSYDLRSLVIHDSKWVELLTLASPIGGQPRGDQALSFPAMRLLLAELIQLELLTHASSAELPDIRLSRSPPPNAA